MILRHLSDFPVHCDPPFVVRCPNEWNVRIVHRLERPCVFSLASFVSLLAIAISRGRHAEVLTESLGEILGAGEAAVHCDLGDIVTRTGYKPVCSSFQTKPPRETGDRFTNRSLEDPVEVKLGERSRPGNLLQREIPVEISANVVHGAANALPVLHCRVLCYPATFHVRSLNPLLCR